MALLGLTTRGAIGDLLAEIGAFSQERGRGRNSSTRRGSAAKGRAGPGGFSAGGTGGAGDMALILLVDPDTAERIAYARAFGQLTRPDGGIRPLMLAMDLRSTGGPRPRRPLRREPGRQRPSL